MKNILVLCTGNSCRSQIAHGWLNYYTDSSKIQIYSAGIETHGLNKMAIETMSEIGIDISHQKSNLISDYDKIQFDFIITVCDNAKENCPVFHSKNSKKIHKNFSDPSKINGDINKIKNSFKKSRDEIRDFCKNFVIENLM
ncbi:MAG: protein tyrosine phosphatase [Flavobacteriaceae bacterium]|nr:protein tyrosine phosphatase [Flavobacteriaceae bacterium]|tara:strand:- start:2623 stop:3045 length:423 start_codon:yes stop_codon:yes gene_type:complete